MNRTFLPLLALFLPVMVVSCGGGDGLITKGDYCSRLATPTCNREIACANIPSSELSYCMTEFQNGCCADDSSCSERATDSTQQMELESVITACTSALATASCADLAAGNPPVACGGTSTYYAPASVVSPHLAGAAARARLLKPR